MTEYSFKEFMDYVDNSEHRHLIEENGLVREETDEEFKQRLIAKLQRSKMTEEIIINDVDVSGCNYYKPARYGGIFCDTSCFCNGENTPNKQCEYNKNCYYKQMKRLEAENKILEKISTHLTDNNLFSVRHLEEENAKLKSTIELIKEYALDMEVLSYVRKDLLDIVNEVLKDD